MYLLDTNTLIYFFKGMGNVSQCLLSQSPQNISIPSIVIFELEVGIAKSTSPQKRTKQLHEILSFVNIISFGEKEAKVSAGIRANLEKKGTPIGQYDLLIGGTTIANQAILVTRNISEFERIEKLQIEN
jgi:tRNA(fMet)-specific endonuclease VapC